MKNFRIFLLAIILLPICGAFARSAETAGPQEMFVQANQHFEKGELEEAREIYENLVHQGLVSPALYYNLANVFYRKGERGKAVLWYKRAQRLAARDNDIAFNLELARSHIRDEKEGVYEKIVAYFTDGELAAATAVLSWIFFLLLGAWLLHRVTGEVPEIALWCLGILLVTSASWFTANVTWRAKPNAIIVAPPGEVRNGPGPDYAVGFTVPEGSEVVVLNQRPEWTQVGVPQQGLKGWLPSAELEIISQS